MRKKLFTLLLAVAASVGTMLAEKVQIGDLYYYLHATNQTAEVTSPNSVKYFGDIAIPASVTYNSVTYSVTSIGQYAFWGYTGLTSVTIPNSVTSIGYEAFDGCSGLTSVTIGNSVTSIGYYAFQGCTGLTSVTIPNSVTSIGKSAFSSCSGLTSVTIGNSVTSIGDNAFCDCSSLTSVTIPNSVTSIGGSAFSGCTGLTSVTIGNSVTSIGMGAFNNCSGLTSVTIGNSVTSIGDNAFDGCTGLTSPVYNAHVFAFMPTSYSGAYTIPDGIESIAGGAFSGCTGLTSVTIGNSVTSIGMGAFNNCSGLTSVTIGNSVTSIGVYAFEDCSGLTSVTIPNSVTSIGDNAFDGCTGLTSVTIGNSVTSIENQAFYGCAGLTSVTIESDAIVSKAYTYDTNLKNIFGDQVKEYIIGNSVTSIGQYAFYGCTGLTSVTIPNSVTSIGESAFNNRKIDKIYFSGTMEEWLNKSWTPGQVSYSYSLFINDVAVTNVVIPNSVISIGYGAFQGCTSLTSVTIPNSVTSIGKSAFSSCSGLTSVIIPNSVTSIGKGAFYGCSSLTSVTIPNSVTSIEGSAFRYCTGLTSVTIPNSVTSIGDNAFDGCTGLTSVTIPNSVTSIGLYAFYGCSNITSVVWNAKNCNSYNFGRQVNSFTFGNEVEHIPANLCNGMSNLTSVIIPNSVTSIGKGAFYGCSSLTSVTIPNSVTSIEGTAFRDCTGLTSVTIPNSVTSIGQYAFYGCTGLTSVTIEAETPPTLDYSVFTSTNNCPIYVPCGTLDAYKTAWSNYAFRISYAPFPYKISTQAEYGSVGITSLENYTICDEQPYHYTLTVTANYGYHFTQWSDGNTDNPRTIILASDTTFTAEFAKNTYTITAKSSNPQWGTTAGDNSALYLDEVEISATANYGYHFVKWNDNNTSNPRTISVTEDKTYTATFAKNVYSITNNAEHGSISGGTLAEYLDEVTLTANPDYGYHFTQWSDGNTDNPRTIVLTQDTTFNAEFAIDKTGNCGDDNALIWTYDAETKTLTITGNGTLNSNYYFGIEAPTQMQKLVIGNEITSIGDSAFYGMSTINHLIIGGSVATIGNYAFAECRNFDDIICYATTVPIINATTFENVGNKQYIYLYVPEDRERAYHRDEFWGEFDIRIKGTEETTTNTKSVTVEPADNTALFIWPIDDNAASYSLQITKDGEVFCTLTFNANGQLTGIAFAPSRNGAAHARTATMSGSAMSFTVTGLNSASKYAYRLSVADESQNELQAYSGEFATNGYEGEVNEGGEPEINTEGIEDVLFTEKATKILHNGQIYILRGDKTYTLQGQEVK